MVGAAVGPDAFARKRGANHGRQRTSVRVALSPCSPRSWSAGPCQGKDGFWRFLSESVASSLAEELVIRQDDLRLAKIVYAPTPEASRTANLLLRGLGLYAAGGRSGACPARFAHPAQFAHPARFNLSRRYFDDRPATLAPSISPGPTNRARRLVRAMGRITSRSA